jgi:hypothetical protein
MTRADPWLFGWDTTPGIVSIWAERRGKALVWRRLEDKIICEQETYRPWLFAAHLQDLSHLTSNLQFDDSVSLSFTKFKEGSGILPTDFLLEAVEEET